VIGAKNNAIKRGSPRVSPPLSGNGHYSMRVTSAGMLTDPAALRKSTQDHHDAVDRVAAAAAAGHRVAVAHYQQDDAFAATAPW
jgi:hypothetical protein